MDACKSDQTNGNREMFSSFKRHISDIFQLEDTASLEKANQEEEKIFGEEKWRFHLEIFRKILEYLISDDTVIENFSDGVIKMEAVFEGLTALLKIQTNSENNLQELETIFSELQNQVKDLFGADSITSELIRDIIFEPMEVICEKWDHDSSLRMDIFTGEVQSKSIYEEYEMRDDMDLGEEIVELILVKKCRFYQLFCIFMELQCSSVENEWNIPELMFVKNFQVQMVKLKLLLNVDEASLDKTYNYEQIGKVAKKAHKFLEDLLAEE